MVSDAIPKQNWAVRLARPKFREETPKTIIAAGAGEAFAGTGVCRCPYMLTGYGEINSNFAPQNFFLNEIQYFSRFYI